MGVICMSNHEKRVLSIQEKIRQFTQLNPSYKGVADPSYKIYLAQCSTLHKLDTMISDFVNADLEPAEFEEALSEIESQVDVIVSR